MKKLKLGKLTALGVITMFGIAVLAGCSAVKNAITNAPNSSMNLAPYFEYMQYGGSVASVGVKFIDSNSLKEVPGTKAYFVLASNPDGTKIIQTGEQIQSYSQYVALVNSSNKKITDLVAEKYATNVFGAGQKDIDANLNCYYSASQEKLYFINPESNGEYFTYTGNSPENFVITQRLESGEFGGAGVLSKKMFDISTSTTSNPGGFVTNVYSSQTGNLIKEIPDSGYLSTNSDNSYFLLDGTVCSMTIIDYTTRISIKFLCRLV